jgi:integrase
LFSVGARHQETSPVASLSLDPKSGVFRIHFRYAGKQYQKSLKTTDEVEAEASKGRIELTLRDLDNGRLDLRPDDDLWEFLRSDGKRTKKVEAPATFTLDDLFTRYEQEMPPGTMEDNSLATFRLHRQHLLSLLGARIAAQAVTMGEMQRYVNVRSKETYRGTRIKSRTVKKEVASFRAVWNWGKLHGLVHGDAPTLGLKYEKETQKPPFQTWEQTERQVARGNLAPVEIKNLWDSLFLNSQQTNDCLQHVKKHAAFPFIYPMLVFVAHTGARRSEMMRSRVEDFDFETGQVSIREKKRDRSVKETRRLVQMTALLKEVMQAWLGGDHPGGAFTFCHDDVVPRSRKRSRTTGHQSEKTRPSSPKARAAAVRERVERRGYEPLTKKEATHHFKQTLAGSKWSVIRGFHVFRHSFASNLAAVGARQEVIDEMMGHQTEEMRRRYRHLFPQESLDALRRAFGG